jgi:uncharacterized protein (DUF4415 family)
MSEKQPPTRSDWIDPDDAPDTSTPYWQERFARAPVLRGRPFAQDPKISTTIRLDADIVRHFRAGGRGWQSRLNAALREWLGRA